MLTGFIPSSALAFAALLAKKREASKWSARSCGARESCKLVHEFAAFLKKGFGLLVQAWKIIDPRAGEAFAALRKAGVKTAVVSNFDTRLRPILKALECDHWFDAMAISAEVINPRN